MEETRDAEQPETRSGEVQTGIGGFFKKHGPVITLIVLVGYVILLGIGVAAEIFRIQWILDWWIFNPPKR